MGISVYTCIFLIALDADYRSLPVWRDHLLVKDSTSAISNRGIECWPIAREGFSGSHQGHGDGCMPTLDRMMYFFHVFSIEFSSRSGKPSGLGWS